MTVGGGHACPFATEDGRVYLASSGKSWVFKAGPKYELLGTGNLGDPSSSSAAASQGRIILKGRRTLFCVGARK